jgi:hypothetical protein
MISELKWRYLDNLGPVLAHRRDRQPLAGEAARVVAELNRNGIAMTSVAALLRDPSCFSSLETAVAELERLAADEIAAARQAANRADGWKTYLLEFLGKHPVLDPQSVYARFALQTEILRIANGYFGMRTRLRTYNVWRNFATKMAPRNSQLWHRDPEDRYVLKGFVYLDDVDRGCGPITYAAGSHPKGGLKRAPAFTKTAEDKARRSDDAQMAEVVPPERWIEGTGPKGTMVFADTRGYHKGGQATERDRLLYMCMFTSRASRYPEGFQRPADFTVPAGINREQISALSAEGRELRGLGKPNGGGV